MKFIIITSLLLSITNTFATVINAEGFSSVDPVFRSNDAFIMITGEAAHQLYMHLEVESDSFGKRKSGKNVTCRLSLNGRDYVCEMTVDASGSFRTVK